MRNTVPVINVMIRLSDAICGTATTIERNGKRLEVRIPPRVDRTPTVILRNALMITDGCPGDLAVQVSISPIAAPNPSFGSDPDQIFQTCLLDVGGVDNPDIQNYVTSRLNRVGRALFFEKATRTIWMAGQSRRAVRGFLHRLPANGFTYDYANFGSQSNQQLVAFIQQVHGTPTPPRARAKWQAVHSVAQWLSTFASDEAFQQSVFGAKQMGRDLDSRDVRTVAALHLPYMRPANVSHTLRAMGGEFIKLDRWMKGFLEWGRLTSPELEGRLQAVRIPLGFFDLVIWAYCEQFVVVTASLDRHFTARFGYLK